MSTSEMLATMESLYTEKDPFPKFYKDLRDEIPETFVKTNLEKATQHTDKKLHPDITKRKLRDAVNEFKENEIKWVQKAAEKEDEKIRFRKLLQKSGEKQTQN